MKVPALIVFLFALRITTSRCQSPYSPFSCVMNNKLMKNEDQITRLYKVLNPDLIRETSTYVSFYLHTKEDLNGYLITPGDNNSLLLSNFDPKRPTKIITHGYMNSKNSQACTLPRDAFLQSGDYNVIVVDWWPMQSIWSTIPLDYWTAASYVTQVGTYVATMINFLETNGMNLQTTTLIGHSLGAHIMGIAGYNAEKEIGYIVGMDPAFPLFESKGPSERLSREDASLVEVIHTNNGECGMPYEMGHYDFHPNGGFIQPGCTTNLCSHSRVYKLYAESIVKDNAFLGRRCKDFESVKGGECFGPVARMGGESMKKAAAPYGMYHVKTNDAPPFAVEA